MSNLFRQEALANAIRPKEGSVVLALPLSNTLLIIGAVVVVALLAIFMVATSYTRTEKVSGWLTQSEGHVRATASASGRITELHVSAGNFVQAGDPIASVRSAADLADGNAGLVLLRSLALQAEAETDQAAAALEILLNEAPRLSSQKAALEEERSNLIGQTTLLDEQISITVESVERAENISERGYISQEEIDRRRAAFLAAQRGRAELDRSIASIDRLIGEVDAELRNLPFRIEEARARARSSQAILDTQIATAAAQSEYRIASTVDARIAALPANLGDSIATGDTVAVLVPTDGEMVAELFIPSRAIGFIRAGQSVRLEYDAFPARRFGAGSGTIREISLTVLAPSEVPISGLAINEPVFRVVVDIEDPNIEAYGERLSLQHGMLLRADILIDRRNLIEWLFDPVFAVR